MADEPKVPESTTKVTAPASEKPAFHVKGVDVPAEVAEPVDVHALPAEPGFAEASLESLIFALRASSSHQLILEIPELEEEVVPPVEHPKGFVETPTHLSSLPEPEEIVVDPGLPIPEAYDTDVISALVQDPFRLYVYWEARPDTLSSISRLFSSEEAKTFRPVVRVTDRKSGEETYYPVKYPGSDWFSVFPDRTYVVEFGVYSPEFGFIRLMGAPEVTTPRGTVAPEIAPEPEYQISTSRFRKVMDASGFTAQPGPLPHETLADWLPPTVVEAFTHVGMGQPLETTQVSALPYSVREILEELMVSDGADLAGNSLLHYLPALLRDAYLAQLAARGKPTGVRNAEQLTEQYDDLEEYEDFEIGEWEDEEEFFVPGVFRFGVGSSAGSELGSMSHRRRRRVPRRKPRKAPVVQQAQRPAPPSPWLPSMDRPTSSGGRALLLPMDLDVPPVCE